MQGFRKLDIDLPRQPLSNHRRWGQLGLLLAVLFLLATAYAYLKKPVGEPAQQMKIAR